MTEDNKELFDRLRQVEMDSALSKQFMENIDRSVEEIKDQIKIFMSEAQRLLRQKVLIDQLQTEVKVLREWKEDHISKFNVMLIQHDQCFDQHNKGKSWWLGVAEKIVSWAIPAIIMWLLFIYKGH